MTARLYSTPLSPIDPARTGLNPLPLDPRATWRGEHLTRPTVTPTRDDVATRPAPAWDIMLSAWHGEAERRGRSLALIGSHRERGDAIATLFDRWGPPAALTESFQAARRVEEASRLDRLEVLTVASDGDTTARSKRPVSRFAPPDAESAHAAVMASPRVFLVFGADDIEPFTRLIAQPALELSTLPDILTGCAALVTAHHALGVPVLRLDVADRSGSAVEETLRTIAEPARLEDWYADRWMIEAPPPPSRFIDARTLRLRGEGTLGHLTGAAADAVEIIGANGTIWVDIESLQTLPNLRSLTVERGVVWSLDRLDHLVHVSLDAPPLAGMASLVERPRLARLALDFATPSQLAELNAAPGLMALALHSTDEPDDALRAIAGIASLRELDLDLLTQALDPLGDLPHLHRLRVSTGPSRPVDLTPLARRRNLQHLALPHASIVSLAPLVDTPIESLTLNAAHLDLSPLADLSTLRHLTLRLASLPATLAPLLAALEELVLEDVDGIDPAAFADMPRLRRLELRGATTVGTLPSLPRVEVVMG